MTETAALAAKPLAALDWVAQGFELVFSPDPNWVLTAADGAAGFGLHAALILAAPLAPGEIVTTGTLIDGIPMQRGQRWTTAIAGIDLGGMDVTFT